MADKTYNGWTNYETWVVALWMGNEEGSCRAGQYMAEEAYDNAEADNSFTREERAALDLADAMKAEYEEAKDCLLARSEASASVWDDLIGAALSEVNWYEIAQHLLEDVDKEDVSAENEPCN